MTTPGYTSFILEAKATARKRGLTWDIPFDRLGKVSHDERWNLNAIVGARPPNSYVSDFGFDVDRLRIMNTIRRQIGQPELEAGQLTQHWRDFYKAVVIDGLLHKRMKPQSVMVNARSIKDLALAAHNTPPWSVSPEHVRQAYNSLLLAGGSGKTADDLRVAIVMILERNYIVEIPTLSQHCIPFDSDNLREVHQVALNRRLEVNGGADSIGNTRKRLSDRKSAAKLPGESEFWELVRICFTEHPRTFSDAIRFAALQLLIITGLRINEIASLPLDCDRWHSYVDADGEVAGKKGGISRALSLRFFAEKKDEDELEDGLCLVEASQYVPTMFEETVVEILTKVKKLTAPLRERLRKQHQSNRLFPEFEPDAIVPAYEIYTMLTGNAYLSSLERFDAALDAQYRQTFDADIFEQIRASQLAGKPSLKSVARYFVERRGSVPRRDSFGDIVLKTTDWAHAYVRVGDVEEDIRTHTPVKLPEMSSANLSDGSQILPHDLMFLVPYRGLIEGRNGGLLDTTRYVVSAPISPASLHRALDGRNTDSIFYRYGSGENGKSMKLLPHELRHLQNAEMFRLGVSDTVITRRFNRNDVVQSHAYDHRSLIEDLRDIDVPDEAQEVLTDNARDVYAMVLKGKASGPIIDEFRRIQAEHGDKVAFDFLNAEADGLHVTPYGFCVNSFAVDPCPKHLECFNGCRHLARTDVDDERVHLERLSERTKAALTRLEALSEDKRPVGWRNQIEHAKVRHINILRTLEARPGTKPFPHGADLYRSAESTLGTSVLDRKIER
ncbi:hypothetical protein [Bradyrhizobium sp. SYSU BS000235]|uniref:hypothetical protein n=1 Tax=Bradyrhizobium sp. SYSU BS000235 TaxID=3411332 RepID=UPI003C730E9E